MLANDIERRIGQGIAQSLGGIEARGSDHPVDMGAGRSDDLPSRVGHFRPDAVAGDKD